MKKVTKRRIVSLMVCIFALSLCALPSNLGFAFGLPLGMASVMGLVM